MAANRTDFQRPTQETESTSILFGKLTAGSSRSLAGVPLIGPRRRYKDVPSFLQNKHYVLGSIWHEESNRKQRVKRLFLFLAWQVWKRVVRAPIAVRLFNGSRFRAYPDCQASSAVMYTRIPDSRDILYLRQHIWEGTLIDVGGQCGVSRTSARGSSAARPVV